VACVSINVRLRQLLAVTVVVDESHSQFWCVEAGSEAADDDDDEALSALLTDVT
jgi:hypothetical protein